MTSWLSVFSKKMKKEKLDERGVVTVVATFNLIKIHAKM